MHLVSSVIVITTLAGCNNPSASKSYISGISKIDLSNASALAIVSGSSLSRGLSPRDSSATTYSIAKVTKDGAVVEATCYDSSGNAITSTSGASPQDLFRVDDDFFIVTFWLQTDSSGTSTKHGFLIRTSDGAAFSLDSAGMPQTTNTYFQNGPQTARDSIGNIYYRKETVASGGMCQGDTAIIKITTSDPSNLTAQQISATSDTVMYFAADSAGNVLYSGSADRLRKKTGGFYNLPSNLFWIGLSNEMFVYDDETIYELSVSDSGEVSKSPYGTNSIYMFGSPKDFYMFRSGSKILLVGSYSDTDQYLEIYNSSGSPKVISTLPKLTVKAATTQGDFLYIAGEDSDKATRILKVNASDYSYSDLIDSGSYDGIYQLIANDDESIVFNAMRMSDGKDVMAKVSSSGSVSVVSESDDLQITSLVKL